ncbi:ROK family transcriptional regulator [Alteromonas sp. C1M14]|uniref:ROK family transcriptional regulator n=1 Tax=Alteromonas sp. C1M14 TaxID=2841567 RepID=UPI001C09E099|nr:ROK family transcriptional regulator [Alteromonas sp. C1M14]MBU2979632.1 ROK family transcriptional regulator [Alteromonas sp. C1M14]
MPANKSSSDTESALWQQQHAAPKGQSGLRATNERRILALIRQHHQLPKADIAKETGLSAQAATVIINKLEKEELVYRGRPQKGKRGQPSIPFSLNAQGAYGLGIRIGRRSIQITLIDFCGKVQAALREQWQYPTVDIMLRFVKKAMAAVTATLNAQQKQKICGVGVAMPFEIWRWSEQAGAPESILEQWRQLSIVPVLQELTSLPVFMCNDHTAACAAELWFGEHKTIHDYLYCFIGTFVGGGLVLNGQLHVGRNGNAGAIGSLPFMQGHGQTQLINQSSLYIFERTLNQHHIDSSFLHSNTAVWPSDLPGLDEWIHGVAEGLAYAALNAHGILDLDGVIIEGAVPRDVLNKILSVCKQKLAEADGRGLSPITLLQGSVGADAQSLGSAHLPLLMLYSI